MKKDKCFTGTKPDQIPVVLTPKEVSLILQIKEHEVINLICKNLLKTIPNLSVHRVASHSLFDLIQEGESSEQLTSATGFINTTIVNAKDSKIGCMFQNEIIKSGEI